MRKQRLNILLEIERLNEQRCKHCIDPQKANGGHCKCSAAIKVRKLGDELLTLTRPRHADAIAVLDNLDYQDLTVKIYEDIKKFGMSDKDIYKTLKIGQTTWVNWKRSVGLIAPKGMKRERVKV